MRNYVIPKELMMSDRRKSLCPKSMFFKHEFITVFKFFFVTLQVLTQTQPFMITDFTNEQLAQILNYLNTVPYQVNRKQLYSPYELYAGFDPKQKASFEQAYDTKVYKDFISKGKRAKNVEESLARTLHDHGIMAALNKFIEVHDPLLCVGVMGGHAVKRTEPMFKNVAHLSRRLTRLGFCMISGGGPGAMEATHLGAWMASYHEDELDDAINILKKAPSFSDNGWLATAFKVMEKYPQSMFQSLGIPTWLYGHEPSTPFATHIAKFFENSIREDDILTLAYGGIIYTPGSAGTLQEIFQDAVQNHYLSFGFSSPMIFLGKDFWTDEMPVYPLLKRLVKKGKYKNLLLTLTDNPDDVIKELILFQHHANVYKDKFVIE